MASNPRPVLAKPTGILLEDHVQHLLDELQELKALRGTLAKAYAQRCGDALWPKVELAIRWHDKGKASKRWQDACQEDWQAWRAGKPLTALRKVGVRHEIISLYLIEKEKATLPEEVAVAVAAHHGKLSHRHEHRWKDDGVPGAEAWWKRFAKRSNAALWAEDADDETSWQTIVDDFYKYAAVRSLLVLADQRASQREDYTLNRSTRPPKLVPFDYRFPHPDKKPVQQLAVQHADEPVLLLRAPTGAGKTSAALLWAEQQIHHHQRADRLVIAMPTRFTANALALGTTESLEQTGLYHSSAGRTTGTAPTLNLEQGRRLEAPVNVCTIDHLLLALTLQEERYQGIAFNLANSCLVLDEVDFYDPFILANLQILLKFCHCNDVPLLLMSATLPTAFKSILKPVLPAVPRIHEDESLNPRPRVQVADILSYTSPTDTPVARLLKERVAQGPLIVYANTVSNARRFYEFFEQLGVATHLYHSRFTSLDKVKKEEILLEHFGRGAQEDTTPRVAIMTQIGEMSINISAEQMITELCPADRLVQRIGRLSRFSEQGDRPGKLWVVVPHQKDRDGEGSTPYPAPYGTFSRKLRGWQPYPAWEATRSLLQQHTTYTVEELFALVEEVIGDKIPLPEEALRNARQLAEKFQQNWLMNPRQTANEELELTDDWRARDIPPQFTVLTQLPEERSFRRYNDFYNHLDEHGVSLPLSKKEKAEEKGEIRTETVYIGDEREAQQVFVAEEKLYTFEKGLLVGER